MPHPTWTSLDPENPQGWHISSIDSSLMGFSIALLLLGAGLLKHITQQRTSSAKSMSTRQALQWISQAKSLEKSKRYDEAITLYDQGLAEYPNDYRLWQERGLLLAILQRFEEAIISYDRANALCTQHGLLAHERGDALLELGRYEEAIASLDLYLRYAPNSAHILADRGYALYKLGRYEEAVRSLQHAIKYAQQDRSSSIRGYYYQVKALHHLGRLDSALLVVQQASQRYPDEKCFVTQQAELQQLITTAPKHKK